MYANLSLTKLPSKNHKYFLTKKEKGAGDVNKKRNVSKDQKYSFPVCFIENYIQNLEIILYHFGTNTPPMNSTHD